MAQTSAQNRSAEASIRGYVYQFDRTIMRILESDPNDSIVVEGIEDIDLITDGHRVAEQCKYLPASKFALPTIRDAVAAMLQYFDEGHDVQYRLYIHTTGSEAIPSALSVEDIKQCLTIKRRKCATTTKLYEKYSDQTLNAFCGSLTITPGPEYESQRRAVVDALSASLRCTVDESEALYYPNALSTVARLAVRSPEDQRRIDRKRFITSIDHKKYLYTTWHAQTIGIDAFIDKVARSLKKDHRIKREMSRFLGISISDKDESEQAAALVRMLATRFYGPGRLDSTVPWTLIVKTSPELLHDLKSRLTASATCFNDGNEVFGFSLDLFNRRPLVVRRGRSRLISATSFDIWLVSLEAYNQANGRIKEPDLFLSQNQLGASISPSLNNDKIVELGNLTIPELVRVLERVS